MDNLKQTLMQAMLDYSGRGLNGYSYLTTNDDQTIFAINAVAQMPNKRSVFTTLLVRLKDNCIIIEHDANNKPLYEALMQAGIPRNQIILAYAGESAEEAA